MPKLSQLVNVKVEDAGERDQKRTLTLTIEADSDLFQLSDMLAREHAITDIENHLKRANRAAIADYAGSGKEFLKGMHKKRKGEIE